MDENEEYFQRQASHRQSRRRFRKINQKGERQTIIDTVDPYPTGKPPIARGYHTVSCAAVAGGLLRALEAALRCSVAVVCVCICVRPPEPVVVALLLEEVSLSQCHQLTPVVCCDALWRSLIPQHVCGSCWIAFTFVFS